MTVSSLRSLARLRRFVRPASWAAGALALYAVAGFVGLPLVAHRYVEKALTEALGREVAFERVGFNPFTLTVDMHDAKLLEQDGSAAAVSFSGLKVNFDIDSLWQGGPVIHALELDGLAFKLVREGENRYNWSDVIERFAGGSVAAGEGKPQAFSVANISISEGLIEVDDRVTGLQHRLDQIEIGLPFISNMQVEVDVFVEPALSARLNGKALEVTGKLRPFTARREARLDFSLKDFELSPWLAYLPFKPGFSVPSGTLDLDLNLDFSQGKADAPAVSLQGTAQVNDLVIHDASGAPVLAVAEAGIELADVKPLIGRYHFSKVRLLQPELDLTRLADGGFNVLQLLPLAATTRTGKPPAAAGQGPQIDFILASGRIRDGVVRYVDRAVKGGFSTQVEAFNADLRDLGTGAELPAELQFDYRLASGEKFSHQDRLRLIPFEYEGSLGIEGVEPTHFAPYYAEALSGGEIRSGRVDGILRYRIAADEPGAGELGFEFGADRLVLTDFALGLAGRKGELVKLGTLGVSGAKVLSRTHQIEVAGLVVDHAALAVTRLPGGRFDFSSLFKTSPAGSQDAPWTVRLGLIEVADSAVRFEDRAGSMPVVLSADQLKLQVSDFSTAKGAKATLDMSGRINGKGQLGVQGTLVAEPFGAELKIDAKALGLVALQPWVRDQAQVDIKDGKLDWQGAVALHTPKGGDGIAGTVTGDVVVKDFVSFDRINSTDFVRWGEVALKQGRLDFAPATLLALDVSSIAIDGLQTRLILDQAGRLNLREIRRVAAEVEGGQGADETQADVVPPAVTEAGAVATGAGPAVTIGRISLKGGRVAFSDRFVRPNYDAFVSGLTGELVGLSSKSDTLAKLNLRGQVGRTVPVTIKGEFNPWREDRRLGIEATVKDFELTGLSGYAGRYVGYGIQRGKLSATLDYQIEDRKLAAQNHIYLDQLTFGDAVDSPDATHLPIRLAVSLLQNSRGEINLDLPISGTLDDPEFSVFGLVLRAFAGLIGKAVTAPFSLLGREDLSSLDFEPGQFRVGERQIEVLRGLATTLTERPGLRLDLTGLASRGDDADGIRRFKLTNQVKALKRSQLEGDENTKPAVWAIELSAEEYASLLKEIYSEAEIKDKPRNMLGFSRSLPVEDMEALLLARINVNDDDIASLARRREASVQRWLIDEGKVGSERIYLRAPTDSEVSHGAREGHGVRFSLR
ncbi:flagellar motor protein MotB [Betaproteobacteria bacterium]|nr:flagellar motor protein MotB [Betaproteobacteria bacterium]